eukprot:TRINITY_DN72160_c0_g1_i1.p1 TRINITY_DN72160_c0_g1~~TRINITY_DN72160_c0_g1_i1.p1  ORF type:complete len:640 (+),score=127.72 TRINITY_DN72160_c0_g1_i1:108-2027(+)
MIAMSRVLLLLIVLFCSCGFAVGEDKAKDQLLEALDGIVAEDDARKVLEPHMAELKKLSSAVVEKVVLKQWWKLAHELVAKSHVQQVDLSFAVRKAVRTLKDEADELLRTLNPKYGQAQQVSPAFQWAQNDTCIFLTIKYTVRWNAPGALEVTDPSVNMSGNEFSFSGLGKHSNNKYKYMLNFKMFDRIDPVASTWSAASVGKLSVVLRKSWARKWPRLLVDKKSKIGNMHVWMEMQEKLDSTLSSVSSASNSPMTCALSQKLYCLPTDSCKKADLCSQCPGKESPDAEMSLCGGAPTDVPSASFSDSDQNEREIGGEVKITKSNKNFDVTSYEVYYGKDSTNPLEGPDGTPLLIGQVTPKGYGEVTVNIPQNTALTDKMTHILVFASNAYGKKATPGAVSIKDAFLPRGKPAAVTFDDENGEKGEIGGPIKITLPEDHEQIVDFVIYWGSSPRKKMGSSEATVFKSSDVKPGETVSHTLPKHTKIKDGATHFIVYAKNEHGENPNGVAVKIVDLMKPCLMKDAASCPEKLEAERASTGDIVVRAKRAREEGDVHPVTQYNFYWGRKSCENGGQTGAKNGLIKEVGKDDFQGEWVIANMPADTTVPSGTTHVLVFAKNAGGESEQCVSVEFKSDAKAEL